MKLTLSRFALATALITGAVATSVQASGLSSSSSAANMQVAQLQLRGGATSPRVAPPPRSANNFGTRQRNTTAAPKRKKDQIRTNLTPDQVWCEISGKC